MRMGRYAGIFFVLYFLAINWPVLAWIESYSAPRDMIWIGPFPFHYFWILLWSLAAFVVLALTGCTVARRIADRVAKFEHRLDQGDE